MTHKEKKEIIAAVLEEIKDAVSHSILRENPGVITAPKPQTLNLTEFCRRLDIRIDELRE